MYIYVYIYIFKISVFLSIFVVVLIASRLLGVIPQLKPKTTYCQLDTKEGGIWAIFLQENAIENFTVCETSATSSLLQWRHNGHDGVSNHQPYDCLLDYLFRRRSKKTSELRVTGLC